MITIINKSVRDHNQIVKIKEDKIEITHKVGRKKVGGFSFPLSEWHIAAKTPSVNCNWNYFQLILKYTKQLDEQSGGECQAQRIRDGIISGIQAAIKELDK